MLKSVIVDSRCLTLPPPYQCATNWLGKTSKIAKPRQTALLKMAGTVKLTERIHQTLIFFTVSGLNIRILQQCLGDLQRKVAFRIGGDRPNVGFCFSPVFSKQLPDSKSLHLGLEEEFCNLLVLSVVESQGVGRTDIFKW